MTLGFLPTPPLCLPSRVQLVQGVVYPLQLICCLFWLVTMIFLFFSRLRARVSQSFKRRSRSIVVLLRSCVILYLSSEIFPSSFRLSVAPARGIIDSVPISFVFQQIFFRYIAVFVSAFLLNLPGTYNVFHEEISRFSRVFVNLDPEPALMFKLMLL